MKFVSIGMTLALLVMLAGCARQKDDVPLTRADADVQSMQVQQAIIFTSF